MHAREQRLADVAREVEVDVGQRRDLLVEEAPEQQLVLDRVDVREPGEVADDRGDRRAPPAAGRQQRAGGVGAPDLDRHLARELEHVAVQEEEAGQAQRGDDPQLLLDARQRLRAVPVAGRVADLELRAAGLRELAVGVLVLGAGIAVAEVRAQVEAQAVGEPARLGHRLGMVLEAGRHRRRGGEHVAVVAAPPRLRRVERLTEADRHQRVLQLGARARVGVDVAGGHAGEAQAARQLLEAPVARAVAAMERALKLDSQALGAEGLAQAAQGGFVVDPALGAAAEADEALGVIGHHVERHARLLPLPARRVARVRVRARQDAAQVAPAALVLDEQGQVAFVVEVDLRPVDRPQPQRMRRLGVLHRPVDPVVVGEGQNVVALLERRRDQLLGQRGTVEERVGGVAVELGVHANRCSHARRSLHTVGLQQPQPHLAAGRERRDRREQPLQRHFRGDRDRRRVQRLGHVGAGEGGAREHAA
jgi:hypothetical protein